MKKLITSLLGLFSKIAKRISDKKEPPASTCQFCGEIGHDESDCPKAAKFKLFHVDRE